MMRALATAATGMISQQLSVDTIANNLANVNTVGFKRGRVHFQDLFYQRLSGGGSLAVEGRQPPAPVEVGHGSRPVATDRVFTQGDTRQTGRALDMVVEGDGFFSVLMPDGTIGYTRDGSFQVDAEGTLVTSSGLAVEPSIVFPPDTVDAMVAPDGTVSALVAGDSAPQELGTLSLVRFLNPAGMRAIGHNLYQETDASGAALSGTAGSEGFGTVVSGFLEMSNVSVVEEMVSLITAQRAYEINSKAIQTADEMLSLANTLRR